MSNKKNKKNKKNDYQDDICDIKSKSNRKKHKRKSKRHFDKDALRGIMDGTVDVDSYQDYVEEEH